MPLNRVKTAQISIHTNAAADVPQSSYSARRNASNGVMDSTYELKALHDLYVRINALCSADQHISMQTLHGLLRDHSIATIQRAVGQIAERNNVSNPVGLLVTMLKSQKTIATLADLGQRS